MNCTLIIEYVVFLVMSCICLNMTCDKLGENLEEIATDIKMDRDVAGATFLAISSSIPEFLTSFISIVVLKQFEDVGFATVAGSGIFNILLIPMLSILAYKGTKINFNRKVGIRDLGFYILSLSALTVSMYLGKFTWITGAVLVGIYLVYVLALVKHQSVKIEWKNTKFKNILGSVGWLIPIAIIIHYSVEVALKLSNLLGVNGFVISVIILAGVTSVPDLLLSIREAKAGEIDSATSNAIGSNIFDINICLGLPLLITMSNITTSFKENVGIIGFLVLSCLATTYVMFTGATKKKSSIMGIVYAMFVAYIYYIA